MCIFVYNVIFINSRRAQQKDACTWFLVIALVHVSVCVCPALRALITSGMVWCDIGRVHWLDKFCDFFPALLYDTCR